MAKPMAGGSKRPPLGKASTASITRALTAGSRMVCADNTGAKELELIIVKGLKGVLNRYPSGGVSDMIVASVKKGKPEMKRQVVLAVIIRQRKQYTRSNGSKIRFEDNAAIIIGEDGLPKGTEIKGPVAREAVDKWNKLGTIASIVV
ncbi:MAG: 50S ribosomal protein L14 [Candidatus Altiarchaeota archaeon]|nr:50S ribosomal protein L14 [Candidatus Altiarchaeota archaeon]